METTEKEFCSICREKLSSVERTKVAEIMDLLKVILVKMNSRLIQDSLICQTCVSKVQAAYKFKTSYVDLSQKVSSWTVKEEPDRKKCGICKNVISLNECIPLFNSVSEPGLSLIKYVSKELESNVYENSVTCELCHKSLISFYDLTRLLSIYDQDHINLVNKLDHVDIKMENWCNRDLVEIKSEMHDTSEDVKGEIEIEESCVKSEELHFKTEDEESVEVERIGQHNDQEETLTLTLCNDYFVTFDELEAFKCYSCEFETKYKNDLVKHMLVHKKPHTVKMFKCNICKYEAKRKWFLKRHMSVHNKSGEVKMFKCDNCEFETKRKSTLKEHMVIHKNSDEVEMFKGQFETKRKKYLNRQTHVQQKQYEEVALFKCDICGHETKNKYSYKKHTLVHKDIDEVETFKCKICQYETKYKNNLTIHMLVHKNPDELEMFKCNICEYQSKHKRSLHIHMFKHKSPDEIEMFKCPLCKFKTKLKRGLKAHLLRHVNTNRVKMYNPLAADML